MDLNQRKELDKMIKENDVKDNTDSLRSEKKSFKIRKDVDLILELKAQTKNGIITLAIESEYDLKSRCTFLHENFPNIYEKLMKDEINVNILRAFLDELFKIESGELDQHEASYNIGMLLKSVYVDKELDKIDNPEDNTKIGKSVSYKDYLKNITD